MRQPTNKPSSYKLFAGGALAILLCHELSVRLGGDKVTMYNFGAPRTGNSAFVEAYSSVNQDSYRIVNTWDPIARFPRGRNASFLNYEHVGKTVLLNSKDPGDTWVSGSHHSCGLAEQMVVKNIEQINAYY